MADSKWHWTVDYSRAASKAKKALPKGIQAQLDLLAKEIEIDGPIRKNWANFGPLKKGKNIPDNAYHCHVKKGRPTYVACWTVENKKIKFVEIYYVGTHENAPY
jgi:hypothetical protein